VTTSEWGRLHDAGLCVRCERKIAEVNGRPFSRRYDVVCDECMNEPRVITWHPMPLGNPLPAIRDEAMRPRRAKAAKLVAQALRTGALVRPDRCEHCGCSTTYSLHGHHHHGYDSPHEIDVEWLCGSCHRKVHPGIRWRRALWGKDWTSTGRENTGISQERTA
jgi:hypothetical protein